ncbi:MAG: hypothetical protein Q4P24_14470 [Rhodobacterales bacterium]|nr:hypothetical protein [Rhodobacterales bacterium]
MATLCRSGAVYGLFHCLPITYVGNLVANMCTHLLGSINSSEPMIDRMPNAGKSGEYPDTIFANSHSGSVESAPVGNSDSEKFP